MKEDLMEAKELEPKEEMEEKMQEENTEVEEIKEEKNKEEILQDEEEKNEKKDEKEEVEIEKSNEIKIDKKQDNEEEQRKEKSKKNKEKQEDSKEDDKNETKKDKKKNSKDNKSEKKGTRKVKKIIISVIIVILVALIFSTVFALTNINNEKIISGVTIKGVEVSGLTKEEAIAKLETVYSEKINNNIMLQYEELESELNPTLMEVNYDIEKAVNEAYSLGRDGNIFTNNYNILGTLIAKRDYDVNMTMNEETTKQTINDIGSNLPGIMIESSYSVEDDELIITRGKEGVVISTDTLLSEVKDMLNDIHERLRALMIL